MDPNVVSWPVLAPQQERWVKIGLGVGVTLIAASFLAYLFRDSITAWSDPNQFAKMSERLRRKKKDQVIGLLSFLMDLVRGVIAVIQDYAPREWMFTKDPTTGQLTNTETKFAYWIERVDRALDKIVMVAKTFILARFDSWSRSGLDSWAEDASRSQVRK